MRKQPLVSICVPVYNVEPYIEKCCRSLFGQSYKNIEYIFIDDCSPDNSINILKQTMADYPNRTKQTKIVGHEKNRGLAAARNSAIDISKGDYIMFVDSDDYIDLVTVEMLVNQAERDIADIVIHDFKYIYINKTIVSHCVLPLAKEEIIKKILSNKLAHSIWGKLYKTALIKNNGIRFIEGIDVGEDYCTCPRIFYYAKKISHCDKCYYNYIRYNNTSYTNNFKEKNIIDMINTLSILDRFFRSKNDYHIYEECLHKQQLRFKVWSILDICKQSSVLWHLMPMVAHLYKELKPYKRMLQLKYKFILWLAEHNCYNILYICINTWTCLKKSIILHINEQK